jgi:hypothetical protein
VGISYPILTSFVDSMISPRDTSPSWVERSQADIILQESGARKASYDLPCRPRANSRRSTSLSPGTVKGHQDDDILAELDRWAEINIDMDTAAKTLPPIRYSQYPPASLEMNRSRSSTRGKAGTV